VLAIQDFLGEDALLGAIRRLPQLVTSSSITGSENRQ